MLNRLGVGMGPFFFGGGGAGALLPLAKGHTPETRYCPACFIIQKFVVLGQTVLMYVGVPKIEEAGLVPLGRCVAGSYVAVCG